MGKNLDKLCADFGNKLACGVFKAFNNDADKAENLILKALDVLQEQGIYAFTLFCESRGDSEKKGAQILESIAEELLRDKLSFIGNGDLLEEIRKDGGLASDIENIIFAIQVLEKTLVYGRYHAKAMKKPKIIGEKTI
ncbi:MAG: hypothetical protein WED07_00280 [Candidatus Freyarchaeum deiterrae]